MKLVVERSGGLVGAKRRVERAGADLTAEQRTALDQVFAAFGGRPPPPDPGADRFIYRLEIQDEAATRSISLPESQTPVELKRIVTD